MLTSYSPTMSVCLSFGAGQVVYSDFFELFFFAENSGLLQLETMSMRAVRLNKTAIKTLS